MPSSQDGPAATPATAADDRWLQLTRAVRELGREPRAAGRLGRAAALATATTGARSAALVLDDPGAVDQAVFCSAADPEETAVLARALVAHRLVTGDERGLDPRPQTTPDAGAGTPGGADPLITAAVEVDGVPYATLCALAPSADGFGPQDRALLDGLAEQVGVSVEAALALEAAAAREAWLVAAGDITQQLLRLTDDVATVAQHIVDHVLRLSGARTVTLVGPSPRDESHFEVRLAAGAGAEQLLGRTHAKAGTYAGRAMETDEGLLLAAGELYSHHTDVELDHPLQSIIAVPLTGADDLRGALVASRRTDQPRFTPFDLALVEAFARQSSLALQLADSRAAQDQLRFQERGEATARRLHDEVIQRLFSVGASIRARSAGDGAVGRDWQPVLDTLDDTIVELRASITSVPDAS